MQMFDIHFNDLNEGIHYFDYKITNAFFQTENYSEISKGLLDVNIRFVKQVNIMTLEFDIKGTVEITCDRCGEPFDQIIDTKQKLYVKLGKEADEPTDDLVIIKNTDNHFNVAHYIYEYINLAVPLKRLHPIVNGQETCNKEKLKLLEKYTVKKSEIDPRWEILKNINY